MNVLFPRTRTIVLAVVAATNPLFVVACGGVSSPTDAGGETPLGPSGASFQTIAWSGNGTEDGSCAAVGVTQTWRFQLTSPSAPTSTLTATFDEGTADVAASLQTNLSGDDNDLVFTANGVGAGGNQISIRYRNPGAASAPLTVVLIGGVEIIVDLATSSAGAITTTANQLGAAVNAHPGSPVTAQLASGNDGSGVVTPMPQTFLSGGGTVNVINDYTAAGVRAGAGNSPFRYSVTTPAGVTLLSASATNGSANSKLNLVGCE